MCGLVEPPSVSVKSGDERSEPEVTSYRTSRTEQAVAEARLGLLYKEDMR